MMTEFGQYLITTLWSFLHLESATSIYHRFLTCYLFTNLLFEIGEIVKNCTATFYDIFLGYVLVCYLDIFMAGQLIKNDRNRNMNFNFSNHNAPFFNLHICNTMWFWVWLSTIDFYLKLKFIYLVYIHCRKSNQML